MCLLKASLLSGASTTSPPRCSATGPFLSPATRRRGHHEHERADAGSLEDDEGASASTEHDLDANHPPRVEEPLRIEAFLHARAQYGERLRQRLEDRNRG